MITKLLDGLEVFLDVGALNSSNLEMPGDGYI